MDLVLTVKRKDNIQESGSNKRYSASYICILWHTDSIVNCFLRHVSSQSVRPHIISVWNRKCVSVSDQFNISVSLSIYLWKVSPRIAANFRRESPRTSVAKVCEISRRFAAKVREISRTFAAKVRRDSADKFAANARKVRVSRGAYCTHKAKIESYLGFISLQKNRTK